MSDIEPKDLYYHGNLFQQVFSSGGLSSSSSSSFLTMQNPNTSINQKLNMSPPSLQEFDSFGTSSYMSGFTTDDCLVQDPMEYYNSFMTTGFGLSSSSSDVVLSSINDGSTNYHQSPATMMTTSSPQHDHSSISSSSTEAGGGGGDHQEDSSSGKKDQQPKGSEDKDQEDENSSKKVSKAKNNKKGEKKQKEPRFAFMTKSEVDHLEDGYRWRKYGQKAVKNSPYPRSYYRCTTQKCGVKKRVERSFQDPSTVITTYEGQHNHPLPSALRGNAAAAAAMFPPSMLTPTSSSSSLMVGSGAGGLGQEFLFQMPNNYMISYNQLAGGSSSSTAGSILSHVYQQSKIHNSRTDDRDHQMQAAGDDYGLLQDMVPGSMFFKQEP
ncbi:WRKY domain containing protein [Trema orientale]|uniref:WRKY domain containing protein n=1 Tax=Trema orientale TaxID=63057 RepID=A0A2P5DL95_TREOI|nr:WRKY domain containing protein [Trema orientale]